MLSDVFKGYIGETLVENESNYYNFNPLLEPPEPLEELD